MGQSCFGGGSLNSASSLVVLRLVIYCLFCAFANDSFCAWHCSTYLTSIHDLHVLRLPPPSSPQSAQQLVDVIILSSLLISLLPQTVFVPAEMIGKNKPLSISYRTLPPCRDRRSALVKKLLSNHHRHPHRPTMTVPAPTRLNNNAISMMMMMMMMMMIPACPTIHWPIISIR